MVYLQPLQLLHLQEFVEEGGVLITLGNSSSLPIHFGLSNGITIRDTDELWAPGGVFRTAIRDQSSPLTYGYGEELGVYFNRGPVFATGGGGRRFRGGGGSELFPSDDGSTTARRTGRGSVDDPDIVQGRPVDLGQPGVEAFREAQREEREAEAEEDREARDQGTRIVMRFAAQPTDLLVSGGIVGGGELANAPALVDAPRGDGHIVMFSFNPFWRGETLGSYALVLNALLHHRHLGTGG